MFLHFSWWALLDLHYLITLGCTTLNMSMANVELLSTEEAAWSVARIRWKVNLWQSWGQHLEVLGLCFISSSALLLCESPGELLLSLNCLFASFPSGKFIYLFGHQDSCWWVLSSRCSWLDPQQVLDVCSICIFLNINHKWLWNMQQHKSWHFCTGVIGRFRRWRTPAWPSPVHHLLINGCFILSHRICSELLAIAAILPL